MKYEKKIIEVNQAIFESGEELALLKQVFKYAAHRIQYHHEDSGWVKSISEKNREAIKFISNQLK